MTLRNFGVQIRNWADSLDANAKRAYGSQTPEPAPRRSETKNNKLLRESVPVFQWFQRRMPTWK